MAKFKPGIPDNFTLDVTPVSDLGDYLDEPSPMPQRRARPLAAEGGEGTASPLAPQVAARTETPASTAAAAQAAPRIDPPTAPSPPPRVATPAPAAPRPDEMPASPPYEAVARPSDAPSTDRVAFGPPPPQAAARAPLPAPFSAPASGPPPIMLREDRVIPQAPTIPAAREPAMNEDRLPKPKAPRREISMTPETLRMSDELIDLIRSGSGQRDTKANELFHALVLLVHEAMDELDPHMIPKRGRWGTPTARAYPLELKNAFLRAVLRKYGAETSSSVPG